MINPGALPGVIHYDQPPARIFNLLFYEYLGGFVAPTADIEAVFGVFYAYALKIVVFNGSVFVNGDVFDAGSARIVFLNAVIYGYAPKLVLRLNFRLLISLPKLN